MRLAKCVRKDNVIPNLNGVLLDLSPFFHLHGTQPIRSLDEEAADKLVEEFIKGSK